MEAGYEYLDIEGDNHKKITLDYISGVISKTKPKFILNEDTFTKVDFNVLPDKPVAETIFVKEYKIWDHYIECRFDRKYQSSMLKSPDHLVFLSSLINSQKVLYVYLCHKFGLHYDPHGPEVIKIWPTTMNIDMPKLITKRKDLIQGFYISEPVQIGKRLEYFVRSHVEKTIFNWGKMSVYILKNESEEF